MHAYRVISISSALALAGCQSLRPANEQRRRVLPPAAEWTSYAIGLSDGRQIAAERAVLQVPENRSTDSSRSITLSLIRLRSTSAAPGRPVVFLDGAPDTGPSSQTVTYASLYPFFERLRASGDVILMDYRGTGESGRLHCSSPASLPDDLFESRATGIRHFVELARRCSRELRTRGVDVRGYTWLEVAADVDDIRRTLGVAKVDLVGFSSGTHAALMTLRRTPDAIGRVVLIGTEGPDHTRKLPSNADLQLERLARVVARDTAWGPLVPDLVKTVRLVMARADSAPFRIKVPRAGMDSSSVVVGSYGLAYFASRNLSGPSELDLLLNLFSTLERGETSVLAQAVRRIYARPGGPMPTSYLMDGAAGVSGQRASRIEREARRSPFSSATSFPYPDIDSAWGYADLGAAYRQPVLSDVPALFVSGELDGNTAPHQAEDIRRGFRHGVHLVVQNAGHSTPLRMPAVSEVIATFLGGGDVEGRALIAPAVRLTPPRTR
jgi:pimeloyl-ACP methyl ester carboxylesterase